MLSFCALPRGCWCEGVLLYCCTAVWQSKIGWQPCDSRVHRKPRVLRARRTLVQAVWCRWTLAESRDSYVCVVALSREPPKLHYSRRSRHEQNGIDTARCCRRVIHAAGERS